MNALGNVFSQLFEQRVRPGAVHFGDDVGDRPADARNLTQTVLRDHPVKRLAQRGQAVGGAQIGARAEIAVAAGKRSTAAKLAQQVCDFGCVELRHRASIA